jgi:hypothetical protein
MDSWRGNSQGINGEQLRVLILTSFWNLTIFSRSASAAT